jgi:hypothetical protein
VFEDEEVTPHTVARSFAERWARGALRQATRLHEARELARLKDWQYDRAEDWSPPWQEVLNAFDDMWVEAHLLVVAAHQLDNWVRRLAREGGSTDARQLDALLAPLRHSLEHLDQAFLEGDTARPDPNQKRKNWALDQLPGGELPLWYFGRHEQLRAFDLIDVAALERECQMVLSMIRDEREAPAIDAYIQSVIDLRRGK